MFKKGVGVFFIFNFFILFILAFVGVTEAWQETITPREWWDEQILLHDFHIEKNSQFLDKNGQVFEEVYSAERRKYLPYEKIPIPVIHAFVAVEDQSFFEHRGVDIRGIGRALLTNVAKEAIEEGGSTITQQLARNLYLSNEKKYDRKLKELLLAYKLEEQYTKEEIIEFYINKIYFQNGVYGIEAASNYYLGKKSNELSLAEIAFLVAIPNNPTLYNPLENLEKTVARQKHILKRMRKSGYITEEQMEKALATDVQLNVEQPKHLYPDYADYVYREFRMLVAEQEGLTKQLQQAKTEDEREEIKQNIQRKTEDWLYKKGVHIHTALDPALQNDAKKGVHQALNKTPLETAVVVIDHHAQAISAVVAGKQFKRATLNRAFQSHRQPGSAMKPLLAFVPYIDKTGATPATIIDASPFCKGSFCPRNYGNAIYGKVTVERAFASSINTAAVRLMNNVGVTNSFAYIEPFQFEKVQDSDYHLASAIGGFTYGVTAAELTKAFTTFATDGIYTPSYAITKVTDDTGNILFAWNQDGKQLWSKATNDKLRTLLHKTVLSGTARRVAMNRTYIGGKTGTTDQVKDLWFVGLTENYTAGVWVGRDDNRSIAAYESAQPQLKIWRHIMHAH